MDPGDGKEGEEEGLENKKVLSQWIKVSLRPLHKEILAEVHEKYFSLAPPSPA